MRTEARPPMRTFRRSAEDRVEISFEVRMVRAVSRGKFNELNPSLLDLGDITKESEPVNAIAAVFDLAAFTTFCKQPDPHLSVPFYLSKFLDWMFEALRSESAQHLTAEGVKLWHDLPIYTKFLGDGI